MVMSPDILLGYLESRDPKDRETGLIWVARYHYDDFLGDVLRLLQDPIADVREQAAQTLSILHRPASIAALVDALYDESYTVRFTAGWALVSFGNVVISPVRDVLLSQHKPARLAAYQVLSRLDTPESRAVLNELWHGE